MRKGIDYTGISVVYVCHDGAGRILLGRRTANCRDEHGRWDPGSGGLKFGERVEDGLRRELMEEYGLEPLEIEFLGFRDVHREHNGERTHWIALDHRVKVDPSKVRICEPHMLDALEWFPLDALPEPLHSQFPGFLERYKERL